MRHWLLLGTIAVLLIVSSCAQQVQVQCNAPYALVENVCCLNENKNDVCDDKEVQTQEPVQPPPEPPSVIINPPPEPKEEQQTPNVTKNVTVAPPPKGSVDALITKLQNTKSYSYIFDGKQIAIMGDVMRIEMTRYLKPDKENPVNTIYVNLKTKTAKAYCEGERREMATVCTDLRGPFSIDYKPYYSKTTMDWLIEVRQLTPVSIEPDAQVLQHRHTDKWVFDKNGVTYTYWVDSQYGMPIRIMIGTGPDADFVDYLEVYFNTVKPDVFEGKI